MIQKFVSNIKWLGWQDSNLRMPIPKTGALPLGYTPAVDFTSTRAAIIELIGIEQYPVSLFLEFSQKLQYLAMFMRPILQPSHRGLALRTFEYW